MLNSKCESVCSPNHFFEPPDSTTSTTPGRRGSIEGTWFARIPMSPVAAAMFTCTTSVELNRDCMKRQVQHECIRCRTRHTWWGRTNESLILSTASAYPRLPRENVEGARRAAAETRRRADMTDGARDGVPIPLTRFSSGWFSDNAGFIPRGYAFILQWLRGWSKHSATDHHHEFRMPAVQAGASGKLSISCRCWLC